LTNSRAVGILGFVMDFHLRCVTAAGRLTHGGSALAVGRASGIVFSVALLVLTGCASGVIVSPGPGPTPLAAATAAPVPHDLSVIGVDFDPPISDVQSIAAGGVRLMAAVENQGLEDETQVRVTARLLDPEAGLEARELLNDTVMVPLLRAGELTVVRFPQVNVLPSRRLYRLELQVEPIAGEHHTEDNFRVYDVTIAADE